MMPTVEFGEYVRLTAPASDAEWLPVENVDTVAMLATNMPVDVHIDITPVGHASTRRGYIAGCSIAFLMPEIPRSDLYETDPATVRWVVGILTAARVGIGVISVDRLLAVRPHSPTPPDRLRAAVVQDVALADRAGGSYL